MTVPTPHARRLRTAGLRAALLARSASLGLASPAHATTHPFHSGITLVPTTKATGTSVAGTASGEWIEFKAARLNDAMTFTAQVARACAGSATVELRLGSRTGRLLATLKRCRAPAASSPIKRFPPTSRRQTAWTTSASCLGAKPGSPPSMK
jgi:hypothetical protein